MDTGVDPIITRREALTGGIVVGAAALLGASGCAKRRWEPLSEDQLHGPIEVPTARGADRPGPGGEGIPGILPRRTWTSAGTIQSRANPMNGVRRITIHHSGIVSSHVRSQAEAASMLESIRRGHVGQGWADIGYHYIVDPQGRVWEGRPLRYQGAHVKDNNPHNLGVMLMGNFDIERPTPAAVAALDAFVVEQMRRHQVALRRSGNTQSGVFTHQELMPTACPGRNLQSYMLAARSSSGRLARA
jgi:N-acetylmuramoyl-L-alanine amidase